MLYLVATPIGNLKDITLRALEVLKDVDLIVCEDTRHTSILLNHYQIKKPLTALNDFNELKMVAEIVERLKLGQNIALVSDAGTPLISDPGFKLVRECLNQEVSVDSIPGPSSVIAALTLSGLPPDKFFFLGYPPEKPGHRLKYFQNILGREENDNIKTTYILFVAPHKLLKTLEDIQTVFGDIQITLARELTKIHQEVTSKSITNWLSQIKKPKGEYVVLFRLAGSS